MEDGGRQEKREKWLDPHRRSEEEINGVKRHDVVRWEEMAGDSELNRKSVSVNSSL